MRSLMERIDKRLMLMKESHDDISSWKGPEVLRAEWEAGDRNRPPGPPYHALRAIAGPATDNPKWAMDWTSPTGHTYYKGEPAPRWTDDEIHSAMRAQMRIWANLVARDAFKGGHNSKVDPNWIQDLMGNGHTELQKMLSMETDEGRVLGGGGFVSYVAGRVREAMAKGVGGDNDSRRALGRVSQLIDSNNPDVADSVAAAVGMQYRQHSSNISSKRDPGNIYGIYTPQIFQMAMKLADALRAGDKQTVSDIKTELNGLRDQIRDSMSLVQGTQTGRRAISIPHDAKDDSEAKKHRDQFMKTKISSMDATLGPDSDATLGGTLYHDKRQDMRGGPDLSGMDSDVIYGALKTAIDTSSDNSSATEKYLASNNVQKINKGDFRYLIRLLSPWLPGGKYPYKGTSNDPEIVNGVPSKWVQDGQPHLMEKPSIIKSLGSSQTESGESTGLEHPFLDQVKPGSRPLSDMERQVLAYLVGLHPKAAGVPFSQGRISREWENIHEPGKIGITAVRVNQVAKKIVEKTGKSIPDLVAEFQATGGASQGSQPSYDMPSADPLGKFQGWMRLYQEETEDLDEGRDPIDSAIIAECVRAVDRLYYWAVIRPIIFG